MAGHKNDGEGVSHLGAGLAMIFVGIMFGLLAPLEFVMLVKVQRPKLTTQFQYLHEECLLHAVQSFSALQMGDLLSMYMYYINKNTCALFYNVYQDNGISNMYNVH